MTAMRTAQKHIDFPSITFKRKLPSLLNARWNSRAIYILIAYFLIRKWRDILEMPSKFIAYERQEAKISTQRYEAGIYEKFLHAIKGVKVSIHQGWPTF